MSKPIVLDLYMAIWEDSTYNLDPTKQNIEPMVAATFGYALESTDRMLVLATEIFTDGLPRQSMTIPMGIIKDVVKVAHVRLPSAFKSHPFLI